MRKLRHLLLVLACGAFTVSADAAELMREQFQYTLGASLSGQVGGSGFGAAWTAQLSPGSTATISTGLTFSDFPVSGNAVTLTIAQTGFGGGLAMLRDIGDSSIPQVGGTLWVSYLYRRTSGGTGGDDSRIPITDSGGSNSRFILTSRDDLLEENGGVGVDNSDEGGTPGRSLQDLATYLLIAKFTNFGAGSVATPQTGQFWALRASDYDLIKSGGITETELNTNFYSTGLDNPVISPISYDTSNTVAITGTIGSGSANYIYTVDELRYGTDLLSVIPEPASSTLLLAAVGLWGATRRKRSASLA